MYSKEQTKDQYEEFGDQGETTISLVDITDSVYNKTGIETAEVIVLFEQELVLEGIRTKTMNELKLWMLVAPYPRSPFAGIWR